MNVDTKLSLNTFQKNNIVANFYQSLLKIDSAWEAINIYYQAKAVFLMPINSLNYHGKYILN